MYCTGCRNPKPLLDSIAIVGPFAWKLKFCKRCNEALWVSLTNKIGFKLTSWASERITMLQIEEDPSVT